MDRSPSCVKKGFNRRAWSACEDRILTSHINTHGEGKWGDISQKAGLKRCGRSCRFRWFNYLRPDIKRVNISMEEEDLIIKLQRLLGNRWSLIAGSLPGRTDNEIKNYWNTNLRKKMKAKTAQKQQKNSKEKKPEGMSSVQPHQVIRTKAMRCTKVFIPPQEVNQSMAKNVAPARDGTRQYDEYLKFLMDLDANELFKPDILNSDLLQVYRDETLEDDSVIGDDSGANYMSSCSTNAAIIENFNAYDSLHEPNAALELKRSVVTFLESDDEWLKRL